MLNTFALASILVAFTPPAVQPGTRTLEQRVAELEAQVASLQKELQALRNPPAPERVVVRPLRNLDAGEVARFLRSVTRGSRGFEVEEFPGLGLVILRGDEKSVEEADKTIRFIEWIGRGKLPHR
jgi:hypothetical protein